MSDTTGAPRELTESWLKEIVAREAAATPGAWTYEAEMRPISEFVHFVIRTMEPQPDTPWSPHFIAWMNGGRDVAASVFQRLDRYQRDKLIDEGVRGRHVQPDAEFIAHSREDIPALLATVASLTAERDAMRAFKEKARVFMALAWADKSSFTNPKAEAAFQVFHDAFFTPDNQLER